MVTLSHLVLYMQSKKCDNLDLYTIVFTCRNKLEPILFHLHVDTHIPHCPISSLHPPPPPPHGKCTALPTKMHLDEINTCPRKCKFIHDKCIIKQNEKIKNKIQLQQNHFKTTCDCLLKYKVLDVRIDITNWTCKNIMYIVAAKISLPSNVTRFPEFQNPIGVCEPC